MKNFRRNYCKDNTEEMGTEIVPKVSTLRVEIDKMEERGLSLNEGTQAYPVFITPKDSIYLVFVPDMEIFTEGKTIAESIEMVRDAIGLKGIDYEDDSKDLPIPSDYDAALAKAAEVKDIFDYSKGILTLVDVDFLEYRKRVRNRAVKKNCTKPYWMSEQAEKAGINFSKVLQEALSEKLSIK